jgi:lipopolysaccharide export system protein LptA
VKTRSPPLLDRASALIALVGLLFGASTVLIPGASGVMGQTLNFASGDSDAPIQVDADDGIEWEQDSQIFTARGNAVAERGNVTLRADVLQVYYRKKLGGGTDIWRLDADGNVRILSGDEKAFGAKGVYDIDNAILVLSGPKVRLVTAEDEISANRQLEWWEKERMAVARGNALAVSGERRLRADVLVAHFRKNKSGKSRMWRVEAFDNVHIVTATDTVTAARAVYNADSSIATLTGSVKITRGENQFNGCSAEVNMKTNISILRGCGSPAAGGQRVRGLLTPGDVKKK